MIKQFSYCLQLAWRDLTRLRSTTCLQALIVAGVCFPILILLAVKRGHVADLRHDLETSPTGRMVKVGPASAGRPFTLSQLGPLAAELGDVDVAYPWTRQTVDISVDIEGYQRITKNVEIHASCPGDPMLIAQDVDVLQAGERHIVLYRSVATLLGVTTGDTVFLHIKSDDESVRVAFLVRAIMPASSKDLVGFVDSVCLDRFKRFKSGAGISEWKLEAKATEPPQRYPSFLLVNDARDPLKPADFDTLTGMGFTTEKVSDDIQTTLGGRSTQYTTKGFSFID